jgi:putative transcription factor
MQCELCGKEKNLTMAIIEGARMNVCSECSGFGKVLQRPVFVEQEKPKHKIYQQEKAPETVEMLVPDFGTKIRRVREKLGIDQDKFGQMIAIKASIVHKIETGEFKPDIDVAKKLEKLLKISLVTNYVEEKKVYTKDESGSLTIGDLIKKGK